MREVVMASPTHLYVAAGESGKPVVSRSVRPPRILLVEDHADSAIALQKLLEQGGCIVGVAGSVEAACKLADDADGGIDLVVCDIGLPDGTGFDLMRQLKQRHGLKGICLSVRDEAELFDPAGANGFVAYLTKPIDVRELEELIAQLAPPSTGKA